MDKSLTYFCQILFVCLAATWYTTNFAYAQDNRILGKWVNNEQSMVIEVYREGSSYSGKIAWLQQGNSTADANNSSTELQTRQVQGIKMLTNFMYSSTAHAWENGTLYDYRNGRSYSCQMWFEGDNADVLYIRSYVGLPFLGTTTQWQHPTATHPVYGRSTSSGK